ncbi:hypothetical protein R3P38DRAFT_3307396 [Favolaschia claudopus]|uniref:Uncharacterized protein n=1 Tax=Favolaschia claudopus TaxID=2862362 RepID=A0AAW0DC38_9AGAR
MYRELSPALAGPPIPVYHTKDPSNIIGVSLGADYAEEESDLKPPSLPDGTLLLYHQTWRALLRGFDPSIHPSISQSDEVARCPRPALPVELVRLIIRAADLAVPWQTHRAGRSVFVRVTTREEEPVVSRVWFWTKPLDVENVAVVQLVTVSRDQGWVNPATEICHSWFEWGVFTSPPSAEDADYRSKGTFTGFENVWSTRKGGKEVWRKSHGNAVASRSYEQYFGTRVGVDEEMWANTSPGSVGVIAVRCCAEQAMWENDARYGEVRVWKWFEPVVSVA